MRVPLHFVFLGFCVSGQAQITRPWVGTYNGQGDFNDRYTCSTKDALGNVYLGGSVTNNDVDRDFVVVMLNAAGTLVWRSELNGLGNGPDEVTAIAVDANSNVVVTGFARSASTGTDYMTAQFDDTGALQWNEYYNNPAANGYDQANAIAIDSNDDVYVTGLSDGDPTGGEAYDYATIKYATNGNLQWVTRYNGTGNGTDEAEAIVVDALDNVYVTGYAFNGLDDDYVTIKYSTLGALQWTQLVSRGGRDRAADMAVDAGNNIYVTGRSFGGTTDDFYTLKYNSAGVQQWATSYDSGQDDRARAMALDATGRVFVTGQSDGDATLLGVNWDYETVAYSAAGAQLWQQRYNGAANQDDFPDDIATNGTAVFVTGDIDADATVNVATDVVTRSYAATTGVLNWSTAFATAGFNDEGRAVLVTATGCLVAGFKQLSPSNTEAIGLHYSTTGALQWQNVVSGAGDNNENIRALRVDASNNVYAAGYSVESRMNRNMALVKFNGSGTALCHRNLDGSSPASLDEAQGVELTTTGDPVVAGYTKNSGESNDITFFRMSTTTCDTTWTHKLGTSANGSDRIYDMTRDAAGNFYMTGRVDNDATLAANDDVYTAKFNAAGTVLWTANYTSAGLDEDRGSFVRVAASGNVYVTGRTWNGTNYDILLLKYNSLGVQQWAQVYSGGNGTDEPNGLVLDAAENAYIVGRAEELTNNVYNYITLKYNSAGAQQWAQQYNGLGAGDDQGEGIAVDAGGNVYVTGFSDRAPLAVNDEDIVTLKYGAAGVLQWSVNYNGAGADKDIGDAIAVNGQGQVVVAGHVTVGAPGAFHYNSVVLIYDQAGVVLYTDLYNSAGNGDEVPSYLLLNGNDFYVGGYTNSVANDRDMLVIKYTGTVGVSSVVLAPKVFLGGAFVSGTGLMNDGLRAAGVVPTTEPYTALGYAYIGTLGGTTTAPVLAVTGNNAIVDWVVVELRSSANSATVVASRSALVQRDGDVVSTDGTSPVSFAVANGSYFVAIRHRNHFGVMTASAVALTGTAAAVNFTLTSTATYGTNAQQTAGTAKVLWSGNTVRDTQLKYTGASNDRDPLLVAVGSTTPNNVVVGYRLEDANLDGSVKYTGAGNDRDPILVNVGSTTPNNTLSEQLP